MASENIIMAMVKNGGDRQVSKLPTEFWSGYVLSAKYLLKRVKDICQRCAYLET